MKTNSKNKVLIFIGRGGRVLAWMWRRTVALKMLEKQFDHGERLGEGLVRLAH